MKTVVLRDPCTCSPTLKVCPACFAWRMTQPVKLQSGMPIKVRGVRRRTRYTKKIIERVFQLYCAGCSNDTIASLCDVANGSVSYILHMEVLDG